MCAKCNLWFDPRLMFLQTKPADRDCEIETVYNNYFALHQPSVVETRKALDAVKGVRRPKYIGRREGI